MYGGLQIGGFGAINSTVVPTKATFVSYEYVLIIVASIGLDQA